jgi:hypothetical protein
MFDTQDQWTHLETFDDFDNGLGELIELWSSSASKTTKASALAHFKENLEAATLEWLDNRAKSKKYAVIAQELAEFEAVLVQSGVALMSASDTVGPATAK